jgi:hypothetical protein
MFPRTEAHSVIDSSKLGEFKDCARKFLWEYILHIRTESPSIHLEFGTAWHYAKEHLLLNGYTPAIQDEAYGMFLEHYRKSFPESSDLVMAPKSPAYAKQAIRSYCEQYAMTNSTFNVIATEIAGRVMVGENRYLTFKMDAIVENSEGIWALDHKTGSRDTRAWDLSWSLSSQMSCYTHALASYFDPEKVQGALIDGTIFRKMGELHKRIPARRSLLSMRNWIANVNYWFDRMEDDWEELDEEFSAIQSTIGPDEYLVAFPQNDKSCTKYGECQYLDFCVGNVHPLKYVEHTPRGFARNVWNPLAPPDDKWVPKKILENGVLRDPSQDELKKYTDAVDVPFIMPNPTEFTFGGFTRNGEEL